MLKSNMSVTSAVNALLTAGDVRGTLYGSKHVGSVTPADKRKAESRAKAKAAKKAKRANRK